MSESPIYILRAMEAMRAPLAMSPGGIADLQVRAMRGDKPEPPKKAMVERHASFRAAILHIRGIISPYFTWGESTDPRDIAYQADMLAIESGIDTVFLAIESPGGYTTGLVEASDSLDALAEVKTVISYSQIIQASAAEWLGVSAESSYGTRSGTYGSIGVYSGLYDYSRYLDKVGVDLKLARDGKYKGMGIFGKPVTDDEMAWIEASVAKSSREFKGRMKVRRKGIESDTMEGQVFDGDDAVRVGLLDGLSPSLHHLIASLYAKPN